MISHHLQKLQKFQNIQHIKNIPPKHKQSVQPYTEGGMSLLSAFGFQLLAKLLIVHC